MIKYFILLVVSGVIIWQSNKVISIEDYKTISALEQALGYDYSAKKPDFSDKRVSANKGEQMVLTGFSSNKKGLKKPQSKHFVCTSCHNIVKEDPNLAEISPETRLDYAIKNNLPFLQGTTLYGAVNRKTYYNGDYEKKYGDLVKLARNDIRQAIQLCAIECAQGRPLKSWELESVLAYLWTLELKVDDIVLDPNEKSKIESSSDSDKKNDALTLLHSKFPQKSEATFIPPPPDRKAGNGLKGNAERGKSIYSTSCLHCHFQGRYSYLDLDTTAISLNHLSRHIDKFSNHSLYQVARWGVPTKSGKKSYMPQYPAEKLSEQQLADLTAYIKS